MSQGAGKIQETTKNEYQKTVKGIVDRTGSGERSRRDGVRGKSETHLVTPVKRQRCNIYIRKEKERSDCSIIRKDE